MNATPAYTRASSISSASSGASTPARRGSSFLATVGHKLAEHHRSVNSAYEAYYGAYARPTTTTAGTSRRASEESQVYLKDALAQQPQVKQQSRASKAWQSVKQHAKEHHESVNSAYKAYYGA